MTYYKILGAGHKAIHGGNFTYTPHEWTPAVEVVPCERGYHVCTVGHLVTWLYAMDEGQLPLEVWECSINGTVKDVGEKVVVSSVRLDRLVGTLDEYDLRWLGTLFAESAVENTDDERVWSCINTVREYCLGLVGENELNTAWSVARGAAWSAARRAVHGAAEGAAESAAWSVARGAAWSAARRAAWSAFGEVVIDYLEG